MNQERIRQAVESVIIAIVQQHVQSGMSLGELRIAAKLETTASEFNAVLDILKMLELIELESVPSTAKGGRPTQRVVVTKAFESLKAMFRRRNEANQTALRTIADSLRRAFEITK